MTDTHYPTKPGFHLTPEGEDLFEAYMYRANYYGCSCHISPPCGLCTHEGHPVCIEETPELWEPDELPSQGEIDWLAINKEFSSR